MTLGATLERFFNSFGIPGYPKTSVPDKVAFPYLTYEIYDGDFLSGEAYPSIEVYYYTESESVPNAMVRTISNRIGLGGVVLPYDDGAVWIKKGNPYAQNVPNEDSTIKQRHINLIYEFLR